MPFFCVRVLVECRAEVTETGQLVPNVGLRLVVAEAEAHLRVTCVNKVMKGAAGAGTAQHSKGPASLRSQEYSQSQSVRQQIERLRILLTEAGILATQRADSCQPPLLSCSEGIGICAAGERERPAGASGTTAPIPIRLIDSFRFDSIRGSQPSRRLRAEPRVCRRAAPRLAADAHSTLATPPSRRRAIERVLAVPLQTRTRTRGRECEYAYEYCLSRRSCTVVTHYWH